MIKAPFNSLFLFIFVLVIPAFANFTQADSAKAKAYCRGEFWGTTATAKNRSEAFARAQSQIASSINSLVAAQTDISSTKKKDKDGRIEASSSFSATSNIKSEVMVLRGFKEIESKPLGNGEHELKGYVCNSFAATYFLDSLRIYLRDSLETFKKLRQELDEDICISANRTIDKMRGWQMGLEVLNQVDRDLQRKYEDAYGEINRWCIDDEIKKRQTIFVAIPTGEEPKNSNAKNNLRKYVIDALVNNPLYTLVEEESKAKFKCDIEITPSYGTYNLTAKITKEILGKRVVASNRSAYVPSSLKNEIEHKKASIELVSQLLKRCGTMSVGETYDGGCKNGLRDGKGKLTYLGGEVYEGEWKADLPHGSGKFTRPDGYIYEGESKNGMQEGRGIEKRPDGTIYDGEWKADKYHGKGKLTDIYGVYIGEFKNGTFDGKGKIVWTDGQVYDGYFKDGMENGKGKATYATGDVYEGDFKNGRFEGKGKYTTINGEVYVGEFKNGKYNGKGKVTYATGDVYEGDFKDSYYEGKGKATRANGDVYVGEFKNSNFEGKGKIKYVNGDVYEGGFKNSKYDGKGKKVFASGHIYEGDFKNDNFEGKGKMIWPNGDVYEGNFKEWLLDGKGKLTYKNGNVLEGEFRKGQFYGKEASKKSGSTFKDARDGKEYRTVEIGNQTWMAENLNYNASGSLCYDNDPANCKKYGRLYNWETAKKVCPAGWHLPSKDEWEILVNNVSNVMTAGAKLKAGNGWDSYQGNSGNGSDDYGFTALPSGAYMDNFGGIGSLSFWWTSTEKDKDTAFLSIITNNSDFLVTLYSFPPYIYIHKLNGSSVRCLRGSEPYSASPAVAPPVNDKPSDKQADELEVVETELGKLKDLCIKKYSEYYCGVGSWTSDSKDMASRMAIIHAKREMAIDIGMLVSTSTKSEISEGSDGVLSSSEESIMVTDSISERVTGVHSRVELGKNVNKKKKSEICTIANKKIHKSNDEIEYYEYYILRNGEIVGSCTYSYFEGDEFEKYTIKYGEGISGIQTQNTRTVYNKEKKEYTAYVMVTLPKALVPTPVSSASATAASSFKDTRDNKTYKMVKIGSQTWMAENLNYNAKDSKCYENDESNCKKYGRLYNWATAKSACPSGWHLPSKAEWEALTKTAGGNKTAGKYLKATSGWNNNGNGEDKFEFSAMSGGEGGSDGKFNSIGNYGLWWSSFESNSGGDYRWYRWYMGYNYDGADYGMRRKSDLYSVRCVKD